MAKRFTEDYKRSYSHLANRLLLRVIDKQFRGKNFTIFMVQNWIYGRTRNQVLEEEFFELMKEIAPGSLDGAFEEFIEEPRRQSSTTAA